MAKKFVFKLQPVLEQRERLEEEHQRRVALIERERVGLEERLKQIQSQISMAKGELRGQLGEHGTSVVVRDVRFQAGATLALLVQAQSTALELAGAYKRLDAARAELLKATSERKAVQMLKDRRRAEWRERIEKAEAAANDEIATGGFVRSMIAERGKEAMRRAEVDVDGADGEAIGGGAW